MHNRYTPTLGLLFCVYLLVLGACADSVARFALGDAGRTFIFAGALTSSAMRFYCSRGEWPDSLAELQRFAVEAETPEKHVLSAAELAREVEFSFPTPEEISFRITGREHRDQVYELRLSDVVCAPPGEAGSTARLSIR